MLSPEYVAGLFDGEGTVSIVYSKVRPWKRDPSKYVLGFKIVSGLSSTFHPILHLLQDQFGGDININKIRQQKHKPVGAWKVTGHSSIEKFLLTIQPHCIIKERQVALGLQYLKTQVPPGHRLSPEAWKARIDLFKELREVNRRGNPKLPNNDIPPSPTEGWNPKKRGYSDRELAEMMEHVRSSQHK